MHPDYKSKYYFHSLFTLVIPILHLTGKKCYCGWSERHGNNIIKKTHLSIKEQIATKLIPYYSTVTMSLNDIQDNAI